MNISKRTDFAGTLTATAAALTLSGCGDPIDNSNRFAQWNNDQIGAITAAHSVSDLVKIPDLENNIRKWVKSPYNDWTMQVMQTTDDGIAGVEQNSIIRIRFGKVGKGTFFARFTDPNNPKEYRDFAIVCANGLLKGMNNLSFTPPSSLPALQESSPVVRSSGNRVDITPKYITMQPGGSLMGTLGVSREEAERIAEKYSLPSYTRGGKYIVVVQPGMEFYSADGIHYEMKSQHYVPKNASSVRVWPYRLENENRGRYIPKNASSVRKSPSR